MGNHILGGLRRAATAISSTASKLRGWDLGMPNVKWARRETHRDSWLNTLEQHGMPSGAAVRLNYVRIVLPCLP